MDNAEFLKKAIEKARESVAQGGFPAGAVVVKDGKIIGEGISIGNKLNVLAVSFCTLLERNREDSICMFESKSIT